MANRRPQNGGGRRMDFGRNDRGKNFGRNTVSPWQGGGPGGTLPNLLPISSGSTEATLALASNLISNLLQPRQNPVPSLLDMPIRRDFGPNVGRYDRGYPPNRMGNQGNFRRTGNYNRSGERMNNNRRPFRPNEGQRPQNKSSPKKEADSKAKPVKESETDTATEDANNDKEKTEDTKKEPPKTRYDDINPQLLKCHICNKSMWDGRSFENHLNGRAHAIMMQKTAESYALTADTMRQEFKIREMKRTRKAGQQPTRDFYCAMCDMYAADGAVHRTTVGHRKLKKYLHPTCTSCHKEMPTRIELDEHRLTAEHLRNMQDKQEIISKPKPEVMVISTLNMEQLYLREDRQRRRRGEERRETEKEEDHEKDGEGETQEDTEGVKEGDGEAKEETEEKKESIDSETTIVDYQEGDDISNITKEQFPAYSTERGVGKSFLSEFRCVQCRLCRKLLDSEETGAVHLRTWRHHQLFTRLLAEKSNKQQTQEGANTSSKRPLNTDDDGNFKRRKTEVTDEQNGHDDNDHDETENENTQENEDQLLQDDGNAEMPPADELENWEQTVDEILEDEQDTTNENIEDTTQSEPAVEEEKPEPVESPKPAATQETEKVASPAPATPSPVPAPVTPSPVPAPVTPSPAPVTPAPATPALSGPAHRASPRVRGRGRGRGRGRY